MWNLLSGPVRNIPTVQRIGNHEGCVALIGFTHLFTAHALAKIIFLYTTTWFFLRRSPRDGTKWYIEAVIEGDSGSILLGAWCATLLRKVQLVCIVMFWLLFRQLYCCGKSLSGRTIVRSLVTTHVMGEFPKTIIRISLTFTELSEFCFRRNSLSTKLLT